MEFVIPCVDCCCSCPRGEAMPGEERTPFPQETQLYTLAARKPVLSPEGTWVLLHGWHPVASTSRLEVA